MKFNTLNEGQGFRHNGRRFRRKGNIAVCLDGGDDLLEDFLMTFIILDFLTDGELDGNFSSGDETSQPVSAGIDTAGSAPEEASSDFGGNDNSSSFDGGSSDFGGGGFDD